MAQESVRKCSQCGNNGHNSRTCNGKGCFKLFGVNIMTQEHHEGMKKTSSMGKLELCTNNNYVEQRARDAVDAGYLSDGPAQFRRSIIDHESKKGKAWTEEEHSNFLIGLKKLGKGNWKSISKEYVRTRTPTQVASHAQKYFLRMLPASENKKRRPSLFDKALIEQGTTPTQAANPCLPLCVELPRGIPISPTYGVQRNPHIVEVPDNGQSFPAGRIAANVTFIPMMSASRPQFFYLTGAFGDFCSLGTQ